MQAPGGGRADASYPTLPYMQTPSSDNATINFSYHLAAIVLFLILIKHDCTTFIHLIIKMEIRIKDHT